MIGLASFCSVLEGAHTYSAQPCRIPLLRFAEQMGSVENPVAAADIVAIALNQSEAGQHWAAEAAADLVATALNQTETYQARIALPADYSPFEFRDRFCVRTGQTFCKGANAHVEQG